MATAVNADGRVEAIDSLGGAWSSWARLGGAADGRINTISGMSPAAHGARVGGITGIAHGWPTPRSSGTWDCHHIWQTSPGGAWSSWVWLGVGVTKVATAVNADGKIEVFAIGIGRALNHIWQTSPGGGWSNWAGLGGGITDPRQPQNPDGRIEVFGIRYRPGVEPYLAGVPWRRLEQLGGVRRRRQQSWPRLPMGMVGLRSLRSGRMAR